MTALLIGIICLIGWAVLQFAVQPAGGLYHILLAAGVIILVRGIATSKWGMPDAP